jgi:hypothetical protein
MAKHASEKISNNLLISELIYFVPELIEDRMLPECLHHDWL